MHQRVTPGTRAMCGFLKDACKARHWTVEMLCREASLSRGTAELIRFTHACPTLNTLILLCTSLNNVKLFTVEEQDTLIDILTGVA